ncbi:MAG: ATP-binding protein [Candidatus Paceibacterota bacterium]
MNSLSDVLKNRPPYSPRPNVTTPPDYLRPPWNPTVPARYADVKAADVPANILEKYQEVRKTRQGLYIHGKVGTGKTHIAYALYRFPVSEGARFWNTTELLKEIREDFGRSVGERREVDESLMEHRNVLFLDDMGAEKISDWVLETFYLIINRYYNEKLPIVFTSNCTIRELADKVGNRIASRIVEMCHVIELPGTDRRLKK